MLNTWKSVGYFLGGFSGLAVGGLMWIGGMAITLSGTRVCAKYGNPPDCISTLHNFELIWLASLIPLGIGLFLLMRAQD